MSFLTLKYRLSLLWQNHLAIISSSAVHSIVDLCAVCVCDGIVDVILASLFIYSITILPALCLPLIGLQKLIAIAVIERNWLLVSVCAQVYEALLLFYKTTTPWSFLKSFTGWWLHFDISHYFYEAVHKHNSHERADWPCQWIATLDPIIIVGFFPFFKKNLLILFSFLFLRFVFFLVASSIARCPTHTNLPLNYSCQSHTYNFQVAVGAFFGDLPIKIVWPTPLVSHSIFTHWLLC